jgi:hypothetical protein
LWRYEVWDGAESGEERDSEYGWEDDYWIEEGLSLEFLIRRLAYLCFGRPLGIQIAARLDMGRELEGDRSYHWFLLEFLFFPGQQNVLFSILRYYK